MRLHAGWVVDHMARFRICSTMEVPIVLMVGLMASTTFGLAARPHSRTFASPQRPRHRTSRSVDGVLDQLWFSPRLLVEFSDLFCYWSSYRAYGASYGMNCRSGDVMEQQRVWLRSGSDLHAFKGRARTFYWLGGPPLAITLHLFHEGSSSGRASVGIP